MPCLVPWWRSCGKGERRECHHEEFVIRSVPSPIVPGRVVYIPLFSLNVSLASSFSMSSASVGVAGSAPSPGDRHMHLRAWRKASEARCSPRSYQFKVGCQKPVAIWPGPFINIEKSRVESVGAEFEWASSSWGDSRCQESSGWHQGTWSAKVLRGRADDALLGPHVISLAHFL